MKIFTIGFTKSTAEKFFARLRHAGVKRVVDVRLNNLSQLAGFAKRDDLRYFLESICSIDYAHRPELAPTQDMLDGYKKHGGNWHDYERKFVRLIEGRHIEEALPRDLFDSACLLCSESEPHHCHRRLVAEYLKNKWGDDVEISHL
jgi:uncharacterized protein (DUF488 family)